MLPSTTHQRNLYVLPLVPLTSEACWHLPLRVIAWQHALSSSATLYHIAALGEIQRTMALSINILTACAGSVMAEILFSPSGRRRGATTISSPW